jgi:hypothetical protein
MAILYQTRSAAIPVGHIRFHCSACKQENVDGLVIQLRESIRAYWLLPLLAISTWWVICSLCGAQHFSKYGFDELSWRTPEDLVDAIYMRTSLVNRILAWLALLLSCLPLIGLIFAIAAVAVNHRTRGWPRTLSLVGLALTTLFHAVFAVLIVLQSLQRVG